MKKKLILFVVEMAMDMRKATDHTAAGLGLTAQWLQRDCMHQPMTEFPTLQMQVMRRRTAATIIKGFPVQVKKALLGRNSLTSIAV
jgi:hypothetical protein